MGSQGKMTMTPLAGRSIQLGPLPFTIYTKDHNNRLILFCRTGLEITDKHVALLSSSGRTFFITSDDVGAYMDYAFKRIRGIVTDPKINDNDKAFIVRGVGKRVAHNLIKNPGSQESVTQSGEFVESVVSLIIQSPKASHQLLALSSVDEGYLLSHSINVCTFCALLGHRLYGNQQAKLWMLGFGGLLHDIGLTKLDQNLVGRPKSLKPEEMIEYRMHTDLGVKVLTSHNAPAEVLNMIVSHHERCDGKGYPRGLQAERIHDYAKICMVADEYDLLTTDTPGHQRKAYVGALAEMWDTPGSYDQKVMNAMLHIVLRNDKLVEGFPRLAARVLGKSEEEITRPVLLEPQEPMHTDSEAEPEELPGEGLEEGEAEADAS